MNPLLHSIIGLGSFSPPAFVVLEILATVACLPGSLVNLEAGAIFGIVRGSLVASLGSTLGATAAFILARWAAHTWMSRQVKRRPWLAAIDDAVSLGGWRVVTLLRLSPIVPFSWFNYFAGLTDISLGEYIAASWLGKLPSVVLYAYLGSAAKNLETLGGARPRSPLEWSFYGAGFVATVVVTLYIARLAHRSLSRTLDVSAG